MYSLRRKRVPGNLTLEPRLVLKEIKRCLMPNGAKGVVCLGQDPIQLHRTVQKRSQRFPGPKKSKKSSVYKFNSRRESGSIQRSELNLAASPMWPGFTVLMNTGIKGLWDLPPWLRGATEVRHMRRSSCMEALMGHCMREDMKGRPRSYWKPQHNELASRARACLPENASYRKWNQPKLQVCCSQERWKGRAI